MVKNCNAAVCCVTALLHYLVQTMGQTDTLQRDHRPHRCAVTVQNCKDTDVRVSDYTIAMLLANE